MTPIHFLLTRTRTDRWLLQVRTTLGLQPIRSFRDQDEARRVLAALNAIGLLAAAYE